MMRLMIVDDDVIIRKGLSKNIAWAEHGFQLVGTAGDGEEGYRLFSEMHPDIVISDIKMPFMDGLEMSRKILGESSETKMILLTGYEEFEYAKQALEIKVFDFILKPVDLEQLLNTAKRAATALKAERKVKRSLRESRPLLKQQFLTNLLNGKYPLESEAAAEAAFLEIPFQSDTFTVFLIKVDEYFNPKIFPDIEAQEVTKLNIVNLCREYLPAESGEILSLGGDEVALISCTKSEDTSSQDALALGELLKNALNVRFDLSVTIGIGKTRKGFTGIADSFKEASAATEFRHIIGKNQVLPVEDTGMPVGGKRFDLPEFDKTLGVKVKMGLIAESLAIVDAIEAKLLERPFVSLSAVRLVGMQLVIYVLHEAEAWERENVPGDKNQLSFEECRAIQEGETVREIFNKVREIVRKLTERANQKRESLQAGLVKTAIEYIEANFAQEGLSLTDVARVVHVSPVYLSIMFKKERNINFSEFLNEVRMTKAMELIRNTNLKTYEVAEQVGYGNPQYFSVCFKKYTGYSPSDFKKQ